VYSRAISSQYGVGPSPVQPTEMPGASRSSAASVSSTRGPMNASNSTATMGAIRRAARTHSSFERSMIPARSSKDRRPSRLPCLGKSRAGRGHLRAGEARRRGRSSRRWPSAPPTQLVERAQEAEQLGSLRRDQRRRSTGGRSRATSQLSYHRPIVVAAVATDRAKDSRRHTRCDEPVRPAGLVVLVRRSRGRELLGLTNRLWYHKVVASH